MSYLRRKLDAVRPAADPDRAPGRLHARSRAAVAPCSGGCRCAPGSLLGVIALAAVGLVAAGRRDLHGAASRSCSTASTARSTRPTPASSARSSRPAAPAPRPRPGQRPRRRLQLDPRRLHRRCAQLEPERSRASVCIPQFGESSPRRGAEAARRRSRCPAHAEHAGGDRVAFFTVAGAERRRQLPRPRLDRGRATPNRILLIAAPLADVDSTLHRLLLIELARHCAVARRR